MTEPEPAEGQIWREHNLGINYVIYHETNGYVMRPQGDRSDLWDSPTAAVKNVFCAHQDQFTFVGWEFGEPSDAMGDPDEHTQWCLWWDYATDGEPSRLFRVGVDNHGFGVFKNKHGNYCAYEQTSGTWTPLPDCDSFMWKPTLSKEERLEDLVRAAATLLSATDGTFLPNVMGELRTAVEGYRKSALSPTQDNLRVHKSMVDGVGICRDVGQD